MTRRTFKGNEIMGLVSDGATTHVSPRFGDGGLSRRVVGLVAATLLSVAAGGSISASDDGPDGGPRFRAGAATANITPPLGLPLVGGWSPLPAKEVHDELHVRVLLLDDGERRVGIVLGDNVGITREVFDDARVRITEALPIEASNLLMASTHTHSAASARGANRMVANDPLAPYQQFIADRIVDAVRIAYERLEPAKIGWGSVNDDSELFNRRWFVQQESQRRNPFGGVDKVRMNPGGGSTLVRPAGPVDPEISFVSVQSSDGRPIAVLGNYSLHYVGGVPSRTVSADYFAVFADHLEKRLGVASQFPPFVGILSNGTSGDVNNINFTSRRSRSEPFERIRIVGEKVANRVFAAMGSVEYHDDVTVDGRFDDLSLAVRKPSEEMLEYLRERRRLQKKGEPAYHSRELTYADRVEQLAETPDEVDVPLQVIRIGDLGIAAIPFEVFTETGLELKQRSPLGDTFTIELANGSYGYLPTPEQHELGGYETWMGTSNVEENATRKIVARLLSMFDDVRGTAADKVHATATDEN